MMARGAKKRLDLEALRLATYDVLMELDRDTEYIKEEIYQRVMDIYEKRAKHVLRLRGDPSSERVAMPICRHFTNEGWITVKRKMIIEDRERLNVRHFKYKGDRQ